MQGGENGGLEVGRNGRKRTWSMGEGKKEKGEEGIDCGEKGRESESGGQKKVVGESAREHTEGENGKVRC